jgi:tetratricopeptide (TPR) repeat protein
MAFRRRGDLDKASATLDEAERSMQYNHAFVYTEHALVHLAQGRLDDAWEKSELALRYSPKSVSLFHYPFRNHGEILLALGRPAAAWEVFSRAARINPFSADIRLGMARAALRQGDRGSAQKFLAEAVRLNPDKGIPAELVRE